MSEAAKAARSAMKSKAERLTKADPQQKVDSSTWSPPEAENADVKTGARPISPRLYKKGGKVVGKAAGNASKARADRTARKSGGRIGKEAEDRSKRYLTPDNLINRDVRMANDAREGKKHVGAFKHGGKAHKLSGGALKRYTEAAGEDRDWREGMLGSMGRDLQGHTFNAKQKWKMSKRDKGIDLAESKLERKGWKINPDTGHYEEPKAKGGKASFPDLTGDGKVTKADILKGRGVIKKFGGGPIGDNPISDQNRSMGKAAGMMKKGGRIHKENGGDAIAKLIRQDEIERGMKGRGLPERIPMPTPRPKSMMPKEGKPTPEEAQMGAKKGGKIKHWEGSKKDETQDALLAKKYGISKEAWEKSDKDKKHDKQQSMEGLKKGGRTAKYSGGGVFSGSSYPGKVPGVVPGGRDAHAKGGKAKGKTNINIIIAAGQKPEGMGMPNAPVPAPKAMPVPPPMPPMPPQGAAPMPPMPPQGGMAMARNTGGRTTHVIDHAAGGGLGRMEKIKAYGHKAGKVVGKK